MRIAISLTLLATAAAAFSGCKTRDPDAAGLLDDDTSPAVASADQDSDAPAVGGDWTITCSPTEPEVDAPIYTLNVTGATTADENQTVRVSVRQQRGGAQDVVAEQVLGHGAVTATGPVFVGFPAGVLTTDAPGAGGTRAGVLTLARERNTAGLKVTCAAVKS